MLRSGCSGAVGFSKILSRPLKDDDSPCSSLLVEVDRYCVVERIGRADWCT